jgi:hypothetical protein
VTCRGRSQLASIFFPLKASLPVLPRKRAIQLGQCGYHNTQKAWADSVGELEHWAAWNAGGEVSRCGICMR